MERIIFANIGWMIHYKGQTASDTISGGGSYRDDDKHEVFNFQNLKGWCYGYVQPKYGTINLSKIDGSIPDNSESIRDVLVIWTARRQKTGGTYIVGWYKHATVYRTWQDSNSKERDEYSYNIKAKASDCTLLPVDERTFEIPRAKSGKNLGFMGQSNVWFANREIPSIIKFKKSVFDYVDSFKRTLTTKHRRVKVNVEARKLVEMSAVEYVQSVYKQRGYVVRSVEKENLGWDLEAKKGKVSLRIEVKGLASDEIVVHITQNEYSKMRERDNADYRLCIVSNVIKSPYLSTFIYDGLRWICEEDNSVSLCFEEQVAAIAYVQ